MRILFCGDVVGRPGRDILTEHLPGLREELALDLVIVNGENAAGGFGITAEICRGLYQVGADVITLGNHAWDQRGTERYIEIRRAAGPRPQLSQGHARQRRCVAAHARRPLGLRLPGAHPALHGPHRRALRLRRGDAAGAPARAVGGCDRVGRIHGEATSEKQALAYLADGRVSLAAGTHTHVPTADHRILPKGTAYISDVGMCGSYESIIGLAVDAPLARFTRKRPGPRAAPADGEATLCAVLVETDDDTGLARHVGVLRQGGVLQAASPV